jgi:hypothetical protein
MHDQDKRIDMHDISQEHTTSTASMVEIVVRCGGRKNIAFSSSPVRCILWITSHPGVTRAERLRLYKGAQRVTETLVRGKDGGES